jgi:hypothetical protein
MYKEPMGLGSHQLARDVNALSFLRIACGFLVIRAVFKTGLSKLVLSKHVP